MRTTSPVCFAPKPARFLKLPTAVPLTSPRSLKPVSTLSCSASSSSCPPRPPLPPVTLFAALFKFDRFEWLIEKATELGVHRIVPVETARSDSGLFAAAPKRSERWRRIARESAQQCRRVAAPEIGDAIRLAAVAFPGRRIRLEERPGSPNLWDCLQPGDPSEVAILLGPEGGWTNPERDRLDAAGWQPATLGSTILRAETAGIAALAIATQWWNRRLH